MVSGYFTVLPMLEEQPQVFVKFTVQIIVECKQKTRKDGILQLQKYLTFCDAVLGVWFNGNEKLFIQKYETKGKVHFKEIPNIPLYGQRTEDVGLFKRKDLKKTHNLI